MTNTYTVTAFDTKAKEHVAFTVEAADTTQARIFCKKKYQGLRNLQLEELNEALQVDFGFVEVSHFLSVKQYRKVRSCRDSVQFPVLDVVIDQQIG